MTEINRREAISLMVGALFVPFIKTSEINFYQPNKLERSAYKRYDITNLKYGNIFAVNSDDNNETYTLFLKTKNSVRVERWRDKGDLESVIYIPVADKMPEKSKKQFQYHIYKLAKKECAFYEIIDGDNSNVYAEYC